MTLQAKLLLRDIESAEQAIIISQKALEKETYRLARLQLKKALNVSRAWLESLEKEFAIVKNF